MKVSQILGKRILKKDGKDGYVISVNADGQNVLFFCADKNEREFFVDAKCVISVDEDIIYEGAELEKRGGTPLRLGQAGFDMRGMFLGAAADFTIECGKLKSVKIGKKNYPAEGIILGDAILVRDFRRLKSDVVKEGKKLFKKGEYLTDEVLTKAADEGEYVQTTLKSL